jgi:hypothetical protein
MKDVGSKIKHGQTETSKEPELPFKFDIKEPELPPKLDIRPGYEQNDPVVYAAKITLGKRKPRNGPIDSRMRGLITYMVLSVWVMWVIFGAIRLTLTGDSTMLLAAPALLLVPLVAVLKYYFSEKHRTSRKQIRRSPKLLSRNKRVR